MFNCYKVFRNGRLYSVVHTEMHALGMIDMVSSYILNVDLKIIWTYEPAFIEGIGF